MAKQKRIKQKEAFLIQLLQLLAPELKALLKDMKR